MSDVSDLVSAARLAPVVVIGGGIAGLVTAYECAKIGMPVTVLESRADLGGAIRTITVEGARAEAGAVAFAPDGAVAELLTALRADEPDLALETVAGTRAGRLTTSPRGLVPLPDGVLGIPGSPFLAEVVSLIGWSGAWRAYLDRLRPPLTIGHERALGPLVRRRMGPKVVDRLVAPVTRGEIGLDPDAVDVELAAPRLNAALTRQGSLSGAVSEILEADAEPERVTLQDGMSTLIAALARRIVELDGEIVTGAEVMAIRRSGGRFVVDSTVEADGREHAAAVVIVATDEGPARRLLAGHVEVPAAAVPQRLATVTATVTGGDAWQDGVYPRPGDSELVVIDDLTTQWGAGIDGARVVRARLTVAADATEAEVARVVGAEITRLLNTTVRATQVEFFAGAPHREQLGFAASAARMRAAVRAVPRLTAVGAWLTGAGLDATVTDAIQAAERVRREVLFGDALPDA
ncbi:protoporphyrinogen/coproporphyrinogen oxidase [Microbacterium gorillae]|uniref:protoporphyrinogen/coproporphyrinogen oxidase n=1 Tax=Microbacterium gorillae TaxID=1231063 RepID=UPI00058E7781|nr:FAD-dependent oxidoreductase [Microbacterium gorillae]